MNKRFLILSLLSLMVCLVAADEKTDFMSLWNYQDPAATETAFQKILPEIKASGDTGRHAELLTQIARTHSLRQNFKQAHEILDKVDTMVAGKAFHKATVRSLLERGRCFNNSAGDKNRAHRGFMDAWELAKENGEDLLAIDAAHMMAIALPPAEQIAWNEKALTIAQDSKDPKAHKWCNRYKERSFEAPGREIVWLRPFN